MWAIDLVNHSSTDVDRVDRVELSELLRSQIKSSRRVAARHLLRSEQHPQYVHWADSKSIDQSLLPDTFGSPSLSLPIRATRRGDIVWIVDAAIGQPAQGPWGLQLDTGSVFSWIRSNTYNPHKSTTAKNTTVPFFLQYTNSNISGHVFTDTFHFGHGDTTIELPGQPFGVVEENVDNDPGLLGFSPLRRQKDQDKVQGDPVFVNMLKRGLIGQDVFAVRFPSGSKQGFLDLGGVQSDIYDGPIKWTKGQDGMTDWIVSNAALNGIDLKSAALDTGSSFFALSTRDFKHFCSSIKGGHVFVEDDHADDPPLLCGVDSKEDIPKVTFSVDDQRFDIKKDTLDMGPAGKYKVTLAVIG
ncbi:unnamed protein product [Sympodiomycopsis kandeliae]